MNFSWLGKYKWILEILDSYQGESKFVGGVVKNGLLDRLVDDKCDFDLATTHIPEAVIAILKSKGVEVIPTGLKHGTVTAISGKTAYEITTLRIDVKTYGRHADVEFTNDWYEDSKRRDFTMNAIYVDKYGTLVDFHGGIKDLFAGRVVFVGDADQRIKEDYVRMFRFFRFFASYGQNEPDEAAMKAISENKSETKTISVERITKEFMLLLQSETPEKSMKAMFDVELLQLITNTESIDNFSTLMEMEKFCEKKSSDLCRLYSLCGTKHSLRLSNNQIHLLKNIDAGLKNGFDVDEKCVIRMLYSFGKEATRDCLFLHFSSLGKQDSYEKFSSLLNFLDYYIMPEMPISGNDLLNFGLSGALIGDTLKKTRTFWLDGMCLATKDECLDYLREIVKKK